MTYDKASDTTYWPLFMRMAMDAPGERMFGIRGEQGGRAPGDGRWFIVARHGKDTDHVFVLTGRLDPPTRRRRLRLAQGGRQSEPDKHLVVNLKGVEWEGEDRNRADSSTLVFFRSDTPRGSSTCPVVANQPRARDSWHMHSNEDASLARVHLNFSCLLKSAYGRAESDSYDLCAVVSIPMDERAPVSLLTTTTADSSRTAAKLLDSGAASRQYTAPSRDTIVPPLQGRSGRTALADMERDYNDLYIDDPHPATIDGGRRSAAARRSYD